MKQLIFSLLISTSSCFSQSNELVAKKIEQNTTTLTHFDRPVGLKNALFSNDSIVSNSDSAKFRFLVQPCDIYIPNYNFTFSPHERSSQLYLLEKSVNLDSFDLILSNAIQAGLFKTLTLSEYRSEFLASFWLHKISGNQTKYDFPFVQSGGILYKNPLYFADHTHPDIINFYRNLDANLDLRDLQKLLSDDGRYTFIAPISYEVSEICEHLSLSCKNGAVHFQIPENKHPSNIPILKTRLSTRQIFYAVNDTLNFTLQNPFEYTFAACNGIPNSEIELFDPISKKWSAHYAIKYSKDCHHSNRNDLTKDSLFNFFFIPQAPGIYRLNVKTVSITQAIQSESLHHELQFFTQPFYVDSAINDYHSIPIIEEEVLEKQQLFFYYKDDKKVSGQAFYFPNNIFIENANALPHLKQLAQRTGIEFVRNANVIPHTINESDKAIIPYDANLVLDRRMSLSTYSKYFAVIGNYVIVNQKPAVLKNTITVTLTNKATRKNEQLLKQFLAENNLKIVSFSFPTIKRHNKIRPLESKPSNWSIFSNLRREEPRVFVIQCATFEPTQIMEITEKMKKSGLFKAISNNICNIYFK